jgi:Family of unknown function (DUF6281)
MRHAALALIGLAFAGCVRAQEGGEGSGGCAAAIVFEDALYLGAGDEKGAPRPGKRAGEAVYPGCDDGGGAEPDTPVNVRAVRGVPNSVALYADGDLYVNHGYPTALPEHPLHAQLDGGRRARVRGRRCRLEGEILMLQPLWVRAGGRRVNVVIDRRTEIHGFDRGGLPYLEEGDRIRIEARGCRGNAVARRIEPGR